MVPMVCQALPSPLVRVSSGNGMCALHSNFNCAEPKPAQQLSTEARLGFAGLASPTALKPSLTDAGRNNPSYSISTNYTPATGRVRKEAGTKIVGGGRGKVLASTNRQVKLEM